MPKTKFQEFVYGVLMTFFMVLAMELYNTGLRTGELTNAGPAACATRDDIHVPDLLCHGVLLYRPPCAQNRVPHGDPGVDNPLLVTLVRASVTVAFMCPIMSFWPR